MWFFGRNKILKIRDVEFHADNENFYSKGLINSSIKKELKIVKNSLSLEDIKPILKNLVDFIQGYKPEIKSGEKVACFSWDLLFDEVGNFFEVLEIIPEKKGFSKGLNRTLEVLNQQLSVCEKLKVKANFPDFDEIVTIDPLIITGIPAHLFRWNRTYPDSGWVAISSDFDEETMTFEEMTLGQLMSLRPEFIQFMALPAGFKVIWEGNNAKIGFDNNLLEN